MGSSLPTCLTIAGSDSSGGAGIQADLKTFAAHGVYGMSAITAVTAQNTLGVQNIDVLPATSVSQQIDSVLNDIPTDAIKLGMLANQEIIQATAKSLTSHQCENIVLDPVMISTSGSRLIDVDAVHSLIHELIPCVDLITPNTAELIALCQTLEIKSPTNNLDIASLEELTKQLSDALPKKHSGARVAVLSKGGHLVSDPNMSQRASDLLLDSNGNCHWFHTKRVETKNTHGTGCTLSAAIAANLAKGSSMESSCRTAKAYLQRALESGLDLGKGNGPLNHLA